MNPVPAAAVAFAVAFVTLFPASTYSPGSTFTHEAELFGVTDQAFAGFGSSVAVAGDTAVVGAPSTDHAAGADAGVADVFVRSGTTWTAQQELMASDAAADDGFGLSVSVSGDTVVVGAPQRDTAGGPNAGAAYVFVRTGTTWTEQQRLTASDGAAFDLFGSAVAVSGDTIVVGAPRHDPAGGADAGSAYVFVRVGTAWTEQQELLASDGATDDNLGLAVAVAGDTAVLGAPFDDGPGGTFNAGSAYVFVRSGAAWSEQQKLEASFAVALDQFGWSVATSGNLLVAGVPFHEAPGGTNSGTAYVFERSGSFWVEQQQLVAADGAAGGELGLSVSVSGDTIVAGAPFTESPGVDPGSAYVFVRSGTTWNQQRKLVAPDGVAGDAFGAAVSLAGDTALIGARADDTAGGVDAGSAHVFGGLVPVDLQSFAVE